MEEELRRQGKMARAGCASQGCRSKVGKLHAVVLQNTCAALEKRWVYWHIARGQAACPVRNGIAEMAHRRLQGAPG